MAKTFDLDIKTFITGQLDSVSGEIKYDPSKLLPKRSEDFVQQVLKDNQGNLVVNEKVHNMFHIFRRKAQRLGFRKYLILGAFSHGKSFLQGNKILMYDGSFKNVEDIEVNDLLMGSDSKPRKVLFLGRGKEKAYKITLSNKDFFTCNESHILSLVFRRDFRKHKRGDIINISLKEYLYQTPEWVKKYCLRLYKVPIEFKKQETTIDPYEYGTKIGGIRSNHGFRYTQFYKIWCKIKERCDNFNCKFYKDYGGRGITYDPKWKTFLGFKEDMYFKYLYAKHQLKVKQPSIERKDVNGNYTFDNCIFIERKDQTKNRRNNRWFEAISPDGNVYLSKNQSVFAKKHGLQQTTISQCLLKNKKIRNGWKFKYIKRKNNEFKLNDKVAPVDVEIDKVYLCNDRETRLQVLAGFLDFHGVKQNETYIVKLKNEKLKDDLLFLCRSLGFSVSWRIDKYKTIDYYVIIISGNTWEIPCRKNIIVERNNRGRDKRECLYYSFNVEPIGEQEYFGFGVDKDHLFLLHDFTVVHNTEQMCIALSLYEIAKNPNILIKIIHVSESEAIARVRAIRDYIQQDEDFKHLCPHVKPTMIWGQGKFVVQRKSVSKDATVQAYGIQSSVLGGRANLLIFDDPQDFKTAVLEPTTRQNIEDLFKNTWTTRLTQPEDTSETLVLMNKWSDADLATYIMNTSTWAWMTLGVSEDKNNLLYEDSFGKKIVLDLWSKFPKESLVNKHIEMGDRDYNRGYRLIAYSETDKSFPSFESCCHYGIKPKDIIGDMRDWVFIGGIDFSSEKRPGNTITICGMNKFTGLKIPVALNAYKKAADLAFGMVDNWKTWNIEWYEAENNAVQGALINMLQTELNRDYQRYNIKIVPFNTGKNKADSQMGLPSLEKEMEKKEWMFCFDRQFTVQDDLNKDLWFRFFTEMKYHPFYKSSDFLMSCWFASVGLKEYVRVGTKKYIH